MLLYFGVTPYLVFDGDNLPSKADTESSRHTRRQESKALGLELQRKGRHAEAYQELQKAVDVTPYMARQLIEELKKLSVQYVVAPYEADAQLVYLERAGIVNGIVSEDSDLLVFGAKRLVTKLDQHGECVEINRADFTACREVSLIGWTDADFRRMCILSGCDYLANIPKLGLKTAYRSIRKYKTVERALQMLRFEGQYQVPPDYLQNFNQAELTFLYQRVFCPTAGKLVTLTFPDHGVNLEELPFIGGDIDPEIAVGVACGDLDPTTKEPIALKPSIPNRLLNGVNRRQTLGSSAELKSNKPINSFFTPKRTPLAELDPNSLTPSPSQQQLLDRHANTSWVPRPAPSRSSLPGRLSSPVVRSAERNSFLARAGRLSTFQPSKRQRLCSDTEESPPSVSDSRSRFFDKTEESSPSGQKLSRSKKSRKSNLGIFSDEIAEDIMSQISDPAKGEADESKGARDDEREDDTPAEASKPTNEPKSQGGCNEHWEQSSSLVPNAEKSVSEEADFKSFHKVLDFHIEKQNSALLSKYSFQPQGSSGSPERGSLQRNMPQVQSRRTLTAKTSSPGLQSSSGTAIRRPMTPLQRLGQHALSRSQSLNALPSRKFNVSPKKESDTQPDSELQSLGASKPVAHGGSEDMLVPDSEEEPESDADGKESQPSSLNLQQFSFSANQSF